MLEYVLLSYDITLEHLSLILFMLDVAVSVIDINYAKKRREGIMSRL